LGIRLCQGLVGLGPVVLKRCHPGPRADNESINADRLAVCCDGYVQRQITFAAGHRRIILSDNEISADRAPGPARAPATGLSAPSRDLFTATRPITALPRGLGKRA
jgi:hypothetical protein